MSDNRPARRIWDALRIVPRAAWQGVIDFYHSDDMTFSSSIAYYSLLSMFPFLLLVLKVLNSITVGDRDATLLQLFSRAIPAHLDFIVMQIQALGQVQLRVGAVGIVLAIWGSMGMFRAITSAINHAWGVERRPSFWKHQRIAFTMLCIAGLLLMLTLVLVSSVQVAKSTWFSGVVDSVPGLDTLRGLVVRNLPTPLFSLIAGLLYYFVPNAKVRLRDVWPGAVLAGALWHGAFSLFSWYMRDLSRFTVLGQITAVALFLVWIYFSSMIFLYGAEVSAAYSRFRMQTKIPPPPRD